MKDGFGMTKGARWSDPLLHKIIREQSSKRARDFLRFLSFEQMRNDYTDRDGN